VAIFEKGLIWRLVLHTAGVVYLMGGNILLTNSSGGFDLG
jgi:hypothetical protein